MIALVTKEVNTLLSIVTSLLTKYATRDEHGNWSFESVSKSCAPVRLTIGKVEGIMEVRIDGVLYVPIPDVPTDKSIEAALEVRIKESDAGNNITIRDYLYKLLKTLWDEQEGFNGKRPFGNSSWERELYKPLIEAGCIEGTIDEDGYIDRLDHKAAEAYVHRLIISAMYPQ